MLSELDLLKGAIEILIYYYYYFHIVYTNLSETIFLEFLIIKKLTIHSHTRCVVIITSMSPGRSASSSYQNASINCCSN